MEAPDFTRARWRKAGASSDTGCVEVAYVTGWVGVRNTKDEALGPVLAFTEHEWTMFLAGVANGEFTSEALSD